MLLTRVVTSVVALIVLVAVIFLASSAAWAMLMLVVALVCCWEWSRMCGLANPGQSAFLAFSGVAAGIFGFLYLRGAPSAFERVALAGFVLAAVFWVAVAPLWVARHVQPPPTLKAVAGWVVIWPTWMAFVALREAGPWVLLASAALVWVADIAAYFAGRRFGRHKLAPTVSPGKTWEGLAGALAGVALYGVALSGLAHFADVPFAPLLQVAGGVPALVAMLALAALSVVGDLFESWMKRGAGLKDSSALLPGHGGMLDRIDALTSTLPVAALILALRATLA